MNILLYAPNYYPATRYGGPVRSSHGLATGLAELGHEVDVVTTNVDGACTLDVPTGVTVKMDGVNVLYFDTAFPKRIYNSPDMFAYVSNNISRYDVVHTNGVFLRPGPRIAQIAQRAKTPLIISPRGMLVPSMVGGRSTQIKRTWISLLERKCLRQASAIHVTSEKEADGVRELGLDLSPLKVVANGVDINGDEPTREAIDEVWRGIEPGLRIAFVARLDWTKGLDLAIEAVKKHPVATLLIAGHDQIGIRQKFDQNLERANGTRIARFLGPLDDAKKWALLFGADLLLAPSVQESFGMSVAEAFRAGTPAICTPGVGAATIAREIHQDLVCDRSVDALNVALELFLDNPELRNRVSKRGRKKMEEEYSWCSIARKMLDVYTAD